MEQTNLQPIQDNDEISLKELIEKVGVVFRYLRSKWLVILLAGGFGGALGYFYAWRQPVKFISKMTFVVEDAKGGGGGLASLAGQFGFDLGGGGGGGIFSGENVLLFLKSESLVRETLFTDYDASGKVTLADRYAEAVKAKAAWEKNEKIGRVDFASLRGKPLPRVADSLMQEMVTGIIKEELMVARTDKKASFIEVKASMQDERLSQLFSERLVSIATQKYVESKTKVKAANVAILQRKADSLGAILNNRTYSAAVSQQGLVDANPGLRTAPIAAEITSRDKTIAATLFGEVVKNLEMSKTLLNQETPVIQMVDQSTLPLTKERVGKLKSLIAGGFIAAFLIVLYLLASRWYRTQIA